MFAKFGPVAVVLAVFTGVAFSQSTPKLTDDKKLVTRVYNIKPLIGERGKANNVPDADAVVKLIFQTIDFGKPKEVPQVIERDGGKLEVRATEETQREIGDLLEALERLQDLAIRVKAEVYELDAATYEKLAKALPKWGKGKANSPVTFTTGKADEGKEPTAEDRKALDEVNKILKTGRLVQTSRGRYINGAESTISSRRSILRYTSNGEPARAPTENPLYVKDGFTLSALPVVSADRRFIRFKLMEQSTAVTGLKKRELGEVDGQKLVAYSPETEDLGATGSAVVDDGGTIIFKLAYAPKDKIWVVVLKPRIFIRAEEELLKKEEK